MARPKSNNVQINISFLKNEKQNLKTLLVSIQLKNAKQLLFLILCVAVFWENINLENNTIVLLIVNILFNIT